MAEKPSVVGVEADEVIVHPQFQHVHDIERHPPRVGIVGCELALDAFQDLAVFEAMGCDTGIDIEKLGAPRDILRAALPGAPLYGAIAKAGLPRNFHPVVQAA